MNSQNDAILAALRQRGSLTPLEALQDFGVFRLAARIHELRLDGNLIVCKWETRNGKRYARYVLNTPGQIEMFG